VAQSLLTGTPSLSASGAISAVGGVAQKAARAGTGLAGNIAGANAAKAKVKAAGGTWAQRQGAFFSSFGKSTADSVRSSLSRNLLGIGKERDPSNWQERKEKGSQHGKDYAAKHGYGPAPSPFITRLGLLPLAWIIRQHRFP